MMIYGVRPQFLPVLCHEEHPWNFSVPFHRHLMFSYILKYAHKCSMKKSIFIYRFLVKRMVEVVVGFQVMMCLFQQWIIPSVKNSLIPFSVSIKTNTVLLYIICLIMRLLLIARKTLVSDSRDIYYFTWLCICFRTWM